MSRYLFISSDIIAARIARIFKLNSNDWLGEIDEDIADFIGLVGVGRIYNKVFKKIKIKNYQGEFPCDLKFLRAIAYNGYKIDLSSNVAHANNDLQICDKNIGNYSFNMNTITTPFKEGCLTVYYYKIPLDKNNKLMVPDNDKFKIACQWYCMSIILAGGVSHPVFKYEDCEARAEKWLARCKNSLSFPTPEEMEEIRQNSSMLLFDTYEDKTFNRY